jgi:DNA-binding Lrp family transcriptional regulator
MGAGRSGTTALATLLGASSEIQSLGEMHQFFEHTCGTRQCSCGAIISDCPYWGQVLERLPGYNDEAWSAYDQERREIEGHRAILGHLFSAKNKHIKHYADLQEKIISAAAEVSGTVTVLDSAKYIGRALALRNLRNVDLKVIYVVRDPRGVIQSFSKKVQTPRGALSALFYYLSVNMVAEVTRLTGLRGRIIKVRYEDFEADPEQLLNKIEDFIGVNLSEVRARLEKGEKFDIAHLIGGNRMRSQENIAFKVDVSWRSSMGRLRQFLVYLGAFPLSLVNAYRPWYRKI